MRCHTNGLPFGLVGDSLLEVELIPWRGRIRAMATAVTVRANFSADELRRLAAASKHANQSRRLLSLAAVLDGMSRADAARIGGMDRQTLRDWVHRFNERAPEGLKDSWSKGHPPRLSGGRRNQDRNGARGVRRIGLLQTTSRSAAIREARPSSSLVASCRRVSGRLRLTGATPRA